MARTNDTGGWDQDLGGGSSIARQTPTSKPKGVVRDDWDDDDDDDVNVEPEQRRDTQASASGNKTEKENEGGESNRIWQEANKRTPMPELIVAPASTSQSVSPPPSAALQPTLRILKRPSPSSSTVTSPSSSSGLNFASGGMSPAPRGTLAEREALYQEARSRIFGEKEKLGGVVVVRDPVGPASELGLESGGPAKGFERRRGKK